MTHGQHHQAAEQLLAEVTTYPPTQRNAEADRLLARAHVHALLATIPAVPPQPAS